MNFKAGSRQKISTKMKYKYGSLCISTPLVLRFAQFFYMGADLILHLLEFSKGRSQGGGQLPWVLDGWWCCQQVCPVGKLVPTSL